MRRLAGPVRRVSRWPAIWALTTMLITGCSAGGSAGGGASDPVGSVSVTAPVDSAAAPPPAPTGPSSSAVSPFSSSRRSFPSSSLSSSLSSPSPSPSSRSAAAGQRTSQESATSSRPPPTTRVRELPAGVAGEASGIAVSSTRPDSYFVVDDGAGTTELDAVRGDGSLIARIRVAGMSAGNAEALAAGPCDGGSCLYVGDIGDGDAHRESVTIYRVPEPTGPPWFADSVAWTYTYADGPRDAESLFVAGDGDLVVISKSHADADGKVAPHRIYRGPPGGGVLRPVGTFTPPAPRHPLQSLLTGTVVTDAAYDGSRVLLLTYDQVVQYAAPSPGADPTDFPSWPHTELPVPMMPQAEGIASLPDRCGFVLASEAGPGGENGRIAILPCGR